MKAAILYELNKPLRIEEISVPELQEGQVLVKIMTSGICHSQLNEIKGKKGPDKYLPHTLGHEGAGIVEDIGPKVTKVKKGDHIILSWIKGSGMNAAAPEYYSDDKRINSGQLSTFNEYTVTSENRVTPIVKEMPLDKAALIGCAVATGMGAVLNNAKLKAGDSIVVFGVGGIGQSAILAAAIVKARIVIAVDINEEKLASAKELGATHTVNAKRTDALATIKEITNGNGVDYAIESAGLVETMEPAFKAVREFGGKAILIGNLFHGQLISIDPFALICGKQIVGSWGGETEPDRDFPKYVELYLSGKLKLDQLITHRFKLEEINEAFSIMEIGKLGRGIIEF
jgi:S-(hydroxymethyl)glutathione dehydrogenase/alcohol dehydrogenase